MERNSKGEYFDKVLIYLYIRQNKADFISSKFVFKTIGVDEQKSHAKILAELWAHNPKYIDAHPGIFGDAPIRINQDGIKYVESILPIDSDSLFNSCEQLFQLHKTDHKMIWGIRGQEQYRPKFSNEAIKLMERQGVVYTERASTHWTTRLEPDVIRANTYEEAIEIIAASKRQPPNKVINMRDGVALIDSQSRELAAFSPMQSPPTNPIIPDTKQGKMNSIIKFTLNNILLVVALAIIGGLVVAYLTKMFGWNK